MLVAKQVADLITFSRGMLFLLLTWVGLARGAQGLPLAALMLLYSWNSDILDGAVARRSRIYYQTWLGDHDLQVDMSVAAGLLLYMVPSGYVSLLAAAFYCLAWVAIFWRWGLYRSLGMLFQAFVYGWFLVIALRDATGYGVALVVWVLAAVVVTWPRFPQEVIPGFLQGMRAIRKPKWGSR